MVPTSRWPGFARVALLAALVATLRSTGYA